MARLPRLEIPLLPHLVTLRVRAGEQLVRDTEDERLFKAALLDAARGHEVAVHAYVVLADALHLLATPASSGQLSLFMQALGRRYVVMYNRRHQRSGGLWAGRFKCAVIDPACYLLEAMLWIEGQVWAAVSGGSTGAAGSGDCSSLAHHLGRATDPLIQDHQAFWALGNTPFEREAVWRRRLLEGQPLSVTSRLLQAVQGGWALGDKAFQERLAKVASRPLVPRPRGRPRKLATA